MMYATKIKMCTGHGNSYSCEHIDSIYLTGNNTEQFYKKATLYDYLTKNPGTIKVDIHPFPNIIPAISAGGVKYVKSEPNNTQNDNLLKLPRV